MMPDANDNTPPEGGEDDTFGADVDYAQAQNDVWDRAQDTTDVTNLLSRDPSKTIGASKTSHDKSDVDSSKFALHHTIGIHPNQVASGRHYHSGADSIRLPAESIIPLAIGAGELASFTPTWTGGGTAPVIGNGSMSIQYFKLGPLVIMWFDIAAGTTTTFGTAGAWTWTLPFPQNGSFPGSGAAMVHNNAKDWVASIKLVANGFQILAEQNGGAAGSVLIGSNVNDPSGNAWLANSFFARVQYTYVTQS